MRVLARAHLSMLACLVFVTVFAGCGAVPSPPQPTPSRAVNAPAPMATARVASAPVPSATPPRTTRIVERAAGFPRRVQGVNGMVEINAAPQRIHTLSVGYDEITLRLVDTSRIAAVGQSTADPRYSNVADLAATLPKVGRDAERIVAARPDLVVASVFADTTLLDLLKGAGITVVVSDLDSSVDADAENIRLLAYLYGEEARGEALVAEVEAQLAAVDATVARQRAGPKPRVLMLQNSFYVSGAGSTGDGIIRRAGGVNVAAEGGIAGTKKVSVEAIIAYAPDYIVVDGTPETNPAGFGQVTGNPALAELPAVRNRRLVGIKGTYLSTLSHWNVRGIEELVKILYPGAGAR